MGATQSKSSEPVIFYNQSSPLQVRFAWDFRQIEQLIDLVFFFHQFSQGIEQHATENKKVHFIASIATH